MRPLLFLTSRSIVNGIRRSLTSSRRLISLIFAIAYFGMMMFRPGSSFRNNNMPMPVAFDLPPMDVLHAFAFAGFAFLSLLLALNTSAQRLSFRPADVDVLFATPVDPKVVLIFRLIRDYTATLFIPLIFVIFGWRSTSAGFAALVKHLPNPHSAAYLFRAMSLAWILMALAWVAISYAVSLFINRSDLVSDRNRKVITVSVIAGILSIAAYIAFRITERPGFSGFVELTKDPILHILFFTATAASTMVMAPIEGNWLPFFVATAGLLTIAFGAVMVAMSQVSWMYDQAAARGFDSLRIRSLQQRGDMMAMAAERARAGKVKGKSWGWFARINAGGAKAILWREVIIQLRTSPLLILVFAAVGIVFGIMPVLARGDREASSGLFFLGMETFCVFMTCMSTSQAGFIEVLRRVDLEKPLPFTATTISFAEVAAKALPAVMSLTIAVVVCTIVRPTLWPYSLAAEIGLPFFAVLFSAVVFLVTVLFPDVDDPTQRGFRNLLVLFGLVVVLLPVVGLALGVGFLSRSFAVGPVLAAGVGAAAALAATLLVCLLAGNFYAQFNPSE